MRLVISWDQNNGIGFRLKSSSAFMGILLALLIYALDGLFLSGSLKTAGLIIVALLLLLVVDGKLDDLSKDRQNTGTFVLKGVFCGGAFALMYCYLFFERYPAIGLPIGGFVGIGRYLILRHGSRNRTGIDADV